FLLPAQNLQTFSTAWKSRGARQASTRRLAARGAGLRVRGGEGFGELLRMERRADAQTTGRMRDRTAVERRHQAQPQTLDLSRPLPDAHAEGRRRKHE